MNAGVITRRIRRRAANWRSFKAEALAVALSKADTVAGAIAYAEAHGKSAADVRAGIVSTLGDCWRNLASRKREVRHLPHMRAYHTRYALGEIAVIRTGQRMLAELDAMPEARILTKGKESARINLAAAGLYAVALAGRILKGSTVADVRDQAAALGWS